MKIGVISDTHLDGPDHRLQMAVEAHFKGADMILHAGDLHSLSVLDAFAGTEVHAVAGNRDRPEVRSALPDRELIQAGGFKIGLIHGWGAPFRLRRRVSSAFEGVHCLVFGHSHLALNRFENGVLFFNPGAFCGGLFSLWKRSLGVLEIDREIRGKIIRI